MGDSGALLLGFTLAALSVQGLLKTAARRDAALPAARAGRADPRHVVRRREADQVRTAGVRGRPDAPAPPLPEHRLLAAAGGADDVGLVRGRSPAPRSRRGSSTPHAHGDWHPWPTVAVALDRRSSRSPRRSTSSTCSRSSSSRTRASAAASRRRRARGRRALAPLADELLQAAPGSRARARALCPAPGSTARSAPSRVLEHVADRVEGRGGGRPRRRASGTAPRRARRAGSRPPTAAARPSAARMPCSSCGRQIARGARARCRRARGSRAANARGSRGPCCEVLVEPLDEVVAPSGSPRARPNAGGSLTASERTRVRPRGGDRGARSRRRRSGRPDGRPSPSSGASSSACSLEVDPLQRAGPAGSRRGSARRRSNRFVQRRLHRRPGLGVPDAAVDQDDPHGAIVP